jgi:excisionase family DNA binding protein
MLPPMRWGYQAGLCLAGPAGAKAWNALPSAKNAEKRRVHMALIERETYHSPAYVAQYLDVCQRTVYNWLRAGELAGIKKGKLWRIPNSAIHIPNLSQEDIANDRNQAAGEGPNVLVLPARS